LKTLCSPLRSSKDIWDELRGGYSSPGVKGANPKKATSLKNLSAKEKPRA
jgi:hypothetical protein